MFSIDFKISPCFGCRMIRSELFPGVCSLTLSIPNKIPSVIRVTFVASKVFTHRINFCIDSVLKHCAVNRKRRISALPNVGPYIRDVKISGFTRSSIYIYGISRLRVKCQSFGTLSVPCSYSPMQMEQTECSETLVFKLQTPEKTPE
jgi:hypothetical protein